MDFVRPSAAAPLAIGRARATRVLIVGPLGHGVGLVADALELAASQSGSPVATVAYMRPALQRQACGALVRLGDTSDAPQGSAHLLLALDVAAAVEARPLLSPTGSGLVLTPSPPLGRRWRLGANFDGLMVDERIRCCWDRTPADAPIVRAWTVLGWLSARIALPLEAWRPALDASVPGRLSLAAQVAFARGRAIDGRPQRF